MNEKELYFKIPQSQCKKGCYKCCVNMIQYTPSEFKAVGGYEFKEKCSHLKDGKCTVYENRPFVCRIYGASELFKCEDCVPERMLSEEETLELVHQYVQLKKKEESDENLRTYTNIVNNRE